LRLAAAIDYNLIFARKRANRGGFYSF
jgi:hypothetical protein